ncbi:hypothetical protein HMPREF0262_03560 [Clostridium sp. ATCC 29733]|nr:hypothetical protein HMPREF0262_03560 [Clostridium sp. ATCC 29733]
MTCPRERSGGGMPPASGPSLGPGGYDGRGEGQQNGCPPFQPPARGEEGRLAGANRVCRGG